jgi:hypothetical protein
MEILEVTSRQFREKQKNFFDMADTGRQIIIRRGRKQAYFLSPVEEDDFVVTPKLLKKLEQARQEFKDGKTTVCRTFEENIQFLNSL